MSIQIERRHELPFVTLHLTYQGQTITLLNALLDTGAASTIVASDIVEPLGIKPRLEDKIDLIYGVGGVEGVYLRQFERLELGGRIMENLDVEIGGMDYGIAIDAIIGMDVLTELGAIINLRTLILTFAD